MRKPFTPTHSVTFDSDGVPRDVMLKDGVAYSAFEWDTETAADLEVSPDGAWLFQGQPFSGTVYVIPAGPRVWPSMNGSVTEAARECAAEAARMCSPAVGRGLDDTEDAGRGDYDLLNAMIGRDATREEMRLFRAAYSDALKRNNEEVPS